MPRLTAPSQTLRENPTQQALVSISNMRRGKELHRRPIKVRSSSKPCPITQVSRDTVTPPRLDSRIKVLNGTSQHRKDEKSRPLPIPRVVVVVVVRKAGSRRTVSAYVNKVLRCNWQGQFN